MVGAALALAAGSTTPVWALVPNEGAGTCTDYAAVTEAPEGAIPRDDMVTVSRDPLTPWLQAHPARAERALDPGATVTVPVVFHVIGKDSTPAGGGVPASAVLEQVQVLNDAFAGAGFSFSLKGITRTTQPEWSNLISASGDRRRLFRGSGKEVRMKQALYQGGSETLNIYTSSLGRFVLGWTYYPWEFTGADAEPLPRFYDGVVVDYRTLPGGAFTSYGEGDTATHEVGHWLGLYHTFQDGCQAPGDRVTDTPYEAVPAFRCPVGRDTCTEDPGADPIHNYMDYTVDACMSEFTPGQADRMAQAWEAYRD